MDADALNDRRHVLGQYFTPPDLVDHVLEVAAASTLEDGSRILEPACGAGAFLAGLARCLRERLLSMDLLAFEIDSEAAALARRTFARALIDHTGIAGARARRLASRAIRVADFLETGLWKQPQIRLAVGNPPFLEAKRMPRAQKATLRRAHPRWTKGAFDLYLPFMGRSLEALSPLGRLAFVLPNKVCIARYGRALRSALLHDAPLSSLTDLSMSGAFEDAAVYPIVVAASRNAPPAVALWSGYRNGDRLRFQHTGALPRRVFAEAPDQVFFTLPEDRGARARWERLLDPPARLGQFLSIRWTVSFHRAGLRDRYLFPTRPASKWALKLLGAGRYQGNRDVDRYRITWRGWWIDYDRSRAKADGNPFPDPRIFAPPKLVICQNALRPRAALDTTGYALKDTFFAAHRTPAAQRDGIPLEALLAVLNSDLVYEWYRTVFGMTRVRGGYLHFLASYLNHVPLPAPHRLASGPWRALVQARSRAEGAEAIDLDARIEAAIREAFNATCP